MITARRFPHKHATRLRKRTPLPVLIAYALLLLLVWVGVSAFKFIGGRKRKHITNAPGRGYEQQATARSINVNPRAA